MNSGGGTLVLMSDRRWRGPGHNSILQTADKHWLVHHVIDAKAPRGGRVLQIRPLQWKDDWPVAMAPLGAGPSQEKTSPIVGRWDHSVNGRDHTDIFLEPTGEITGTKGRAYWELDGRDLMMKWEGPQAAGGFWVDRVKLSPSGQTYSGRNQQGIRITGQKYTR